MPGIETRTSLTIAVACVALGVASCSVTAMRKSDSFAVFNTVAHSSDGRFLAAGRNMNNVVHLYDAQTLEHRRALLGRDESLHGIDMAARSLMFSPDSRILAAAGIDDTVIAWDVEDGREVLRLTRMAGVNALAISPTGELLVTAGPGDAIALWTFPDGERAGSLSGHEGSVTAVAFSPDGKLLASGGTGRVVRLWRVADWQEIAVLEGHESPVASLSFSPDGKTLAVHAGDLHLWDFQTGRQPVQELSEPDRGTERVLQVFLFVIWLEPLSLQSVGKLGGTHAPLLTDPSDASHHIGDVAERLPAVFSPTGKHLAVLRRNISLSGDYEIVLLDMETLEETRIDCQCFDMAFAPDGSVLATVSSRISLWDPDSGKEIFR